MQTLLAVIPYKESGWYDGQVWLKLPKVSGASRLVFVPSKHKNHEDIYCLK